MGTWSPERERKRESESKSLSDAKESSRHVTVLNMLGFSYMRRISLSLCAENHIIIEGTLALHWRSHKIYKEGSMQLQLRSQVAL